MNRILFKYTKISVILLLIFDITSCAAIEIEEEIIKRTDRGGDDLCFGVIADTHLGTGGSYLNHRRFEKVLDWYNMESVDALAIVGDITDNATHAQWNTFEKSWEKHKGDLQLIAVMGNHDVYSGNIVGTGLFEAATKQKTNAHYVIRGYHFIVLSTGSGDFTNTGAIGGAIATGHTDTPGNGTNLGDNVPKSVLDWLRERIEIAKSDAPGKPVFVFLHWPVYNTFIQSDRFYTTSFGNDPLTGFFKNDPEVVIFGGHVHQPNNDPRAIWQESFTSVNVPPMYYMAMGPTGYLGNSIDGTTNSAFPKIAGLPAGAGQGLIVTVRGSKVSIENFDFDFSEGATPLSNIIKIPQTWEFDVSQPADFPYTQAKRETQKTAPVFDETKPAETGLSMTIIKKIEDTSIEVEFPQAKIPEPNHGNEVVYSYHFDFINRQTGAIERSVRQWSDFMLTPRLQKSTYTQLIGGLKPGTDYELQIFAYSSFQECSKQYITQIFRTH